MTTLHSRPGPCPREIIAEFERAAAWLQVVLATLRHGTAGMPPELRTLIVQRFRDHAAAGLRGLEVESVRQQAKASCKGSA